MSTKEDRTSNREEVLMTYCQVVQYPQEAYATDDAIAGAEADTMNTKQPEIMSAVRSSDTFWEEALRCRRF